MVCLLAARAMTQEFGACSHRVEVTPVGHGRRHGERERHHGLRGAVCRLRDRWRHARGRGAGGDSGTGHVVGGRRASRGGPGGDARLRGLGERSRNEATSVEYATSDGTARADEDYTGVSGTLTFAANETSRTVSVTVLDDAHDEGEETLTLRLSNASGSGVADGEATGTIENRDRLPRALLARFGRTAAVHVVEHGAGAGLPGPFRGPELRRGMERDVRTVGAAILS